jgi:hypothetical protein
MCHVPASTGVGGTCCLQSLLPARSFSFPPRSVTSRRQIVRRDLSSRQIFSFPPDLFPSRHIFTSVAFTDNDAARGGDL